MLRTKKQQEASYPRRARATPNKVDYVAKLFSVHVQMRVQGNISAGFTINLGYAYGQWFLGNLRELGIAKYFRLILLVGVQMK